jgi:hypothetical protein
VLAILFAANVCAALGLMPVFASAILDDGCGAAGRLRFVGAPAALWAALGGAIKPAAARELTDAFTRLFGAAAFKPPRDAMAAALVAAK